MTTLRGKVSHFGGPDDMGVSPSEGLAFYYEVSDAPELFLPQQPPGTTGLARRLDPEQFYIATRWDYSQTPKTMLPDMLVRVTNVKTGKSVMAVPADWGPAGPESDHDTGRVADISPGLMECLGLQTDDEVIVEYQPIGVTIMPYDSIVISSGHGTIVRGASGILDEVDEAIKVMDALAIALRNRGVDVTTFTDKTSTSQNQNLNTIVNFHNSKNRQLDISVHFNAYEQVSKPMGVEVLYVTQGALAGEVSAAIADVGFIDRGPKKRTDLFFLNNTEMPAILLEVCFVDSEADAEIYEAEFEAIIENIATVLGGEGEDAGEGEGTLPPEVEPPPVTAPSVRLDIQAVGNVSLFINGVDVTDRLEGGTK